jgi:peptidoglycan/LPS O-acetylase OafA/YrhL
MASVRSDIQTLRALAVLAVVVGHMNPAWLPGGYLGVDMFFVISGFVIAQMLIKAQAAGAVDLRVFWLQRVWRIVPAYVVMLGVVGWVTALLFLPKNFQEFQQSWWHALGFLSNQFFAGYGDYFSPAVVEQPLLHTWSLAVEMQYYVVFPLVFVLMSRWGFLKVLPWVFVLALALAEWWWRSATYTPPLYYDLLLRVPEFLLGASLAAWGGKRVVSEAQAPLWVSLGVLLLVLAFAGVDEARFSPLAAMLACVGTAMVIGARVSQGLWARFFSWPLLVWLGGLSYSLYLWHWPLLAWARYALGGFDWSVLGALLYASISLTLAYASWRWVENRFRVFGRRTWCASFKPMLLLLTVMATPWVAARSINASVPQLTLEQSRYAAPKSICHGHADVSCVRGQGVPQILLMGDSHAAMLNHTADAMAPLLGQSFTVMSVSSCLPLPGMGFDALSPDAQAACVAQTALVEEAMKRHAVLVLAGKWSLHAQNTTLESSLQRFFVTAAGQAQRVVVLAQIPKIHLDPRRVFRLHHLGITLEPRLDAKAEEANEAMALFVGQFPSVHWLDVTDAPMFATVPIHQGQDLYMDRHHFNEWGAQQYAGLLAPALRVALSKAMRP